MEAITVQHDKNLTDHDILVVVHTKLESMIETLNDANVSGQITPNVGDAWSPSSSSQGSLTATITQNTTFTLTAADGIATSTCNFTASPA